MSFKDINLQEQDKVQLIKDSESLIDGKTTGKDSGSLSAGKSIGKDSEVLIDGKTTGKDSESSIDGKSIGEARKTLPGDKGPGLLINGKAPAPHKLSAYSVSFNDRNKAVEAADGTVHIKHLSKKAVIELTWSLLTDDEIHEIMRGINYEGRNRIRYYDYTQAFDAKNRCNADGYFYVEGRNASIASMDGNKILWQDFSLTFTEH